MDVPSHRNWAIDGYALASAELPAGAPSVEVAGTSWPAAFKGRQPRAVRAHLTARRCRTTDTVVMQEHVRLDGARVLIEAGHHAGQNVRPVGEDIRRGEARAWTRHAAATGPAWPAGLARRRGGGCARRAGVVIFSTGDELRSIGEELALGQIYDSNRYTLHGMLSRLQVEVIDLAVVPNTREATLRAFESAAAQADAIVTSGGVSVGEADT